MAEGDIHKEQGEDHRQDVGEAAFINQPAKLLESEGHR